MALDPRSYAMAAAMDLGIGQGDMLTEQLTEEEKLRRKQKQMEGATAQMGMSPLGGAASALGLRMS